MNYRKESAILNKMKDLIWEMEIMEIYIECAEIRQDMLETNMPGYKGNESKPYRLELVNLRIKYKDLKLNL